MLFLHPHCPTSRDPSFTYMEAMALFGTSAPLPVLLFHLKHPCTLSAFCVCPPVDSTPHPSRRCVSFAHCFIPTV